MVTEARDISMRTDKDNNLYYSCPCGKQFYKPSYNILERTNFKKIRVYICSCGNDHRIEESI